MGKYSVFEIIFSNPNGVVHPGTILKGSVVLEVTEPMKIRVLTLKFEGLAFVHWSEGSNPRRNYTSRELYFSDIIVLFGSLSSQRNDADTLPPGRYVYPFQYPIPLGCPSSFNDGGMGRVVYVAKGTIDSPWMLDINTIRPFEVQNMLNLNLLLMCAQSADGQNQKNICCFCCESGPVEATLRIDRLGYVPGESIKINAEIHNGSNRKMTGSFVALNMVITYHVKSYTKVVRVEVDRVCRPEILPHREDTWNGEILVVPQLPPSFLSGCRIIDINYILALNVVPAGPATKLTVPIGVIIGSIPLGSVIDRQPSLAALLFALSI